MVFISHLWRPLVPKKEIVQNENVCNFSLCWPSSDLPFIQYVDIPSMIEKMPVPLFENSTFEMRNIIIIINQIYHNLFALNVCYVCCEWCSFSLRHCLPITARGSQDISLDKASFPPTQCGNKYPKKDKRNPVFGHVLSKTINRYFETNLGSGM